MKSTLPRPAIALGVLLALDLAACGGDIQHESLAQRGSQLARDPAIARTPYNSFACTTCHAEHPGDVGLRVLPGPVLEGVARRPSYWGGETTSLHEATQRCFVDFMRGLATDLDGPTGAALAAWLVALSPPGDDAGAAPVPATFVTVVSDIPAGDPSHGGEVYAHACAICHGALNAGPVLGASVVIPRDTLAVHDDPSQFMPGMEGVYLREIVIEKVRHGRFLGYSGTMPPFTREALSDADLGDVLGYMNLPHAR